MGHVCSSKIFVFALAFTSLLIRIYTVCHSVIDFLLKPLFATMDVSKFRDGRVYFRKSEVKGLNKYLYSEIVLLLFLHVMGTLFTVSIETP